jgi:hypothetical protein
MLKILFKNSNTNVLIGFNVKENQKSGIMFYPCAHSLQVSAKLTEKSGFQL